MEKELKRGIRNLKHDISTIRDSLGSLSRKKEGCYRAKEELSGKIGEIIARIRELKSKRDSMTKQVKEKKEERDKLNAAAKSESDSLRKLVSEKQDMMKKLHIRVSPSDIAKELERLEFRLETEGYTFEREKSEMKKINMLKSQLNNSKEVIGILNAIGAKRGNVRESRSHANKIHSEIKSMSSESQKLHEEILKLSGEIDGLMPKRDDTVKKWLEIKDEIRKLNLQFREKLKAWEYTKAEMDRSEMQKIKSKEAEAEEKIRKGGKLTTEDLLAFQDFVRR